MPEQAPWRFQKITKPMFDVKAGHVLLLGRVLTCVGDEVIEHGFVELEAGKIKAVGKTADLGSRRTDGIETGGTILPGLIQSHGHLAWDGIHDLAAQSMNDEPEISAYKCAGNMLINLRAGVTTFRDLGMKRTNLFAKRAVAQGIFPGPRLLVCGEAIVQTGGHTYWCCLEASGPDEMRKAVRNQVRGGADLIKIMACHDKLEFTDEEMHAVIDEAHRNGLPVTAHATFNEAIERVVEAGIDCVEHGGRMTQQTIDLLVKKNIPIVTTFAPLVQQSQPEIAKAYGIPDWKLAERQKMVADKGRYEGLVAAAKAGVAIAFGTDCGSPAVQHDVIAPELGFMIKLGVKRDAYDAIRSATIVPAGIYKLDSKIGTLEAGKLADVITVAGNPLEDINDIAKVTMTFCEGRRLV
ncbi:MAG: amidohydrolase family protein [Methylobacterium sp.]|nr:amidohydrolase family protein [Methylobacterium sp.]MCA3602356.1 amidohydrolase family protein [Methylobacterium sp.]MCA3613926.1 amidohydrolase family protein [Methylobacterium sp.]MCA3641387.1 amidohydrolase family protein [Methylobacterium sp.]